jgi:drug/metabolite transporter (DMT)-like permease
MIDLIFLYAIFAGTFTLGKYLIVYLPPIALVGVRFMVTGVVLLSYHIMRHGWRSLGLLSMREYLTLAFTSVYVPYFLRFWCLCQLPASKVSFYYALSPFITTGLSYILHQRRLTLQHAIGLGLGFAGFSISVMDGNGGAGGTYSMIPALLMIIAVCSASYGWMFIHELLHTKHITPIHLNGMGMLLGGSMSAITLWITDLAGSCENTTLYGWSLLGLLILLSNVICHNIYITLLKRYSPNLMSFAQFLCPIFATMYGWVLFNEQCTINFFLAIICGLSGLWFFYRADAPKVAA